MNKQTACEVISLHVAPFDGNKADRLDRCGRNLLSRLGFAALLLLSMPAPAQVLGAAQSFAVLGGSAVNANGVGNIVNGDVGVSPGGSITGFPAAASVTPPFATHITDGPANSARAATLTLYNFLAAVGGATPILPGLNGQVLNPGTYSTGAALLPVGGTLTLSGAGRYVIQIASSLTTGVGSNVVLLNGANPCNVFWQVTTLATLDGATFPGNVVAQTGAHLGTGAALTGRALAAAAGDVTMAGGNSVGGCSVAGSGLAAASVSTVASPGVTLGAPISDNATLSGGGIAPLQPTGTITFNLFGPNDAVCAGPIVFTSSPVVNFNGPYVSGNFTPLAAGTYRWVANYSGDANNTATANACNAANESVIVAAAPPPLNAPGAPTLSEWAMILLGGLLAYFGFTAIKQRER